MAYNRLARRKCQAVKRPFHRKAGAIDEIVRWLSEIETAGHQLFRFFVVKRQPGKVVVEVAAQRLRSSPQEISDVEICADGVVDFQERLHALLLFGGAFKIQTVLRRDSDLAADVFEQSRLVLAESILAFAG